MMDLSQAREKIDHLDRDIAQLLEERLAVVDALSDHKAQHGLPVHDPAREHLVIGRLKALCSPAYQDDIARLYEQLFAISRARQQHRRGSSD